MATGLEEHLCMKSASERLMKVHYFYEMQVRYKRKAEISRILAADGGFIDNPRHELIGRVSLVHSYMMKISDRS